MRLKIIPTSIALPLIASTAFLALALSPRVASADDASHPQDAENTFAKWIISSTPAPGVLLDMAGVVGGDVGRGKFTGEVLEATFPSQPDDPGCIHALYHFNGRFHSFTADVHVTQLRDKAVIIGVVMDGWLQGNLVGIHADYMPT